MTRKRKQKAKWSYSNSTGDNSFRDMDRLMGEILRFSYLCYRCSQIPLYAPKML